MTERPAGEIPAPGELADSGELHGRPTAGELHGRPTAGELLDATVGFLRDDLAGRLEGADRHMLRIAVHALEVVGREWALGPAQATAHAERLAGLGFATDRDLAAAIRTGSLPDGPELRLVLRAETADRLRVANPGWLPPDVPPGSPVP